MSSLIASLVTTMFSDACSKLDRKSSALADLPLKLEDEGGLDDTARRKENAQEDVLTQIPAVHLSDGHSASADSYHCLQSSSSSSRVGQREGRLYHSSLPSGTSAGISEVEKPAISRQSSSSSGGTTVDARALSDSEAYNGAVTVVMHQGNPPVLQNSVLKTPMNVERSTRKTVTMPVGETAETMFDGAAFGMSFGALIGNLAQRLEQNAETNTATPEGDVHAVVPSSSLSRVLSSTNAQSNTHIPKHKKAVSAACAAESAAAVAFSADRATTMQSMLLARTSATSSGNSGTEPIHEQNISTHSLVNIGHNDRSSTAKNWRPSSAGSQQRLGIAVSRIGRSYGKIRSRCMGHESAVGTTRPLQNFTCPSRMNLESPLMSKQTLPWTLVPRAASLRTHQSWTHFLPLERGAASARTLSASTPASTSTLSTVASSVMPPSKPDPPAITSRDTLQQTSGILKRQPLKLSSHVVPAARQGRANARHATAQRATLKRNTSLRGVATSVSPHVQSYCDDSAMREALMPSPQSTCSSSAIRMSVGIPEEFSVPPRHW